MKHNPHPPFDAFPPDHASAICGDTPMDMEEFEPLIHEHPPAIPLENEAPPGYTGCFGLIAAACIGFTAGGAASILGTVIVCAFIGVEVPWPW